MSTIVITVHILAAAFWFGASLLLVTVVGPALAAAGPDAAVPVAAQLFGRVSRALGIAGAITILSGLWLYWLVSGGGSSFMHSTGGTLVAIGALFGVAAVAAGIITGRLGPRGANVARISVALQFCALTLMIVGSRS